MELQHIHPNAVAVVSKLVKALVAKDENAPQNYKVSGRLTFFELRSILAGYGAIFTEISEKALAEIKVIQVTAAKNTWMVDIDLWTTEGVSDLSLSLMITIHNDLVNVFVDDLHVL